ncbi:MAG: methyl-accepting chemotaxis protein [Chloroflexi bacterium OHK40]
MIVAEPERPLALRDNLGMLRLLIASGVLFVGMLWAAVLSLWSLRLVDGVPAVMATLIAAAALAVYFCAHWLLRRGRGALGGRVLFYAMVLCAGYGAFLLGGAAGPLIPLLFVPIVSAGLLGRGRDSLGVTVAAGAVYLALAGLEAAGVYRPLATPAILAGVVFLVVAGFLAYLAWLSGSDLTRVVHQSQERAEELLRKTEQLMEKSIQQVELGSELAAAAQQLQVASQQQASGAAEQASAVSQVSTTIEELGSTARQIAQSADHVAQAAQQTLENLSSGQDAVDESIQAMERIRGRVADVSARVLSLGERSQQIGEIIDLIDDISDETHLLALNAAIEAAGAGEHGRRFAVVAAEVKSLANRTLAAAREVKGVIAEIRQATTVAVLAAEEGSKEVERGVELAHRAGQVMDNIVMVAERTAQAAAEIGLATAQQQSASEQVVESMREIAEVARQTALGSRQMAESAATLTAIADRLHGIVASDE